MSTTPPSGVTTVTEVTILPAETLTFTSTFLAFDPGRTTTWTSSALVTMVYPVSTETIIAAVPILPDSTSLIASATDSSSSLSPSHYSFATYASSSLSSLSSSSTAVPIFLSSTGVTTLAPTSTSSAVVQKASSHTTAIATGVSVSVGVVFIGLLLFCCRKRRRGTGSIRKHEVSQSGWTGEDSGIPLSQLSGPVPETGGGNFRVGSPPRPARPASITGDTLERMDRETPDYIRGVQPAPRPEDSWNPDRPSTSTMDRAPEPDRTRDLHRKTMKERGLIPDITSRHDGYREESALQMAERRKSYQGPPVKPLRLQKRPVSDGSGLPGRGPRDRYGSSDSELTTPMPQQENVDSVRHGFSEREEDDEEEQDYPSMTDDGLRSYYANNRQMVRSRANAYATLEAGRPQSVDPSQGFGPRSAPSSNPVPDLPARRRPPMAAGATSDRRRDLTEDTIQTFF